MQDTRITISWLPGCDGPEFKFATHDEAKAFVMQFLAASKLWLQKYYPEEYKGDKPPTIHHGVVVPHNYIRGCIYIDHMVDFFQERSTNFKFSMTMVGSNHGYMITEFLMSIIQHGPLMTPEQFNFKPNWQYRTHEEREELRSEAIITVIAASRSNPRITFDFEDCERELRFMMKDEYVPRVIAAIKAVDQNAPNPNGFFASALAAEPQELSAADPLPVPSAQDLGQVFLQPSLEQVKLSLLQFVPRFMNLVNTSQSIDTLLTLEAMLNRAVTLCSEPNNEPVLIEVEQPHYFDPPRFGSNSNL